MSHVPRCHTHPVGMSTVAIGGIPRSTATTRAVGTMRTASTQDGAHPLLTSHTPLLLIFRFQGTGTPESIRERRERRRPNIPHREEFTP